MVTCSAKELHEIHELEKWHETSQHKNNLNNSECTWECSDTPLNNNVITKNDRQRDIELDEIEMNEDFPMEFKLQLKDLLYEHRLVCANPDETIDVTNKMSNKIQ